MTMMSSSNNSNSNNVNNVVAGGQFGDTTLTKVFVGGLAWETPKEAMKDHFDQYGDILEAVIISDKLTGRSKGYGFVTFKEPEAAKKACEDATPVINGRRANCNLASLGARRPSARSASSVTPPRHVGPNVGPRSAATAPANHVQWYYPASSPAATPFHHHQHQAVPYYGYAPTPYIATEIGYNHVQKVGYTGGSYMAGHYSQVYPSPTMIGANTLMPMYPLYYHHQSHQAMGLPAAHMYSQPTAGPMTTHVPAILSKPPSIVPNTGTIGWGGGGFQKEGYSGK